jgi:hypothetical protein
MVSGTMAITRATLMSGSGAIGAQRGNQNWGANWVYNPQGAQNDILVIADTFEKFSTSGAYATDAEVAAVSGAITTSGTLTAARLTSPVITGGTQFQPAITSGSLLDCQLGSDLRMVSSGVQKIGSNAYPIAVSGIYMNNTAGVPMRLVIYSNGSVSGIAAA